MECSEESTLSKELVLPVAQATTAASGGHLKIISYAVQ